MYELATVPEGYRLQPPTAPLRGAAPLGLGGTLLFRAAPGRSKNIRKKTDCVYGNLWDDGGEESG